VGYTLVALASTVMKRFGPPLVERAGVIALENSLRMEHRYNSLSIDCVHSISDLRVGNASDACDQELNSKATLEPAHWTLAAGEPQHHP